MANHQSTIKIWRACYKSGWVRSEMKICKEYDIWNKNHYPSGTTEADSFFGSMFELFIEACFIMFSVTKQHLIMESIVPAKLQLSKAAVWCLQQNILVGSRNDSQKLSPGSCRTLKTLFVLKVNSDWLKYAFAAISSGKRTEEAGIPPRGFISLKYAARRRILKVWGGQTRDNMNLWGMCRCRKAETKPVSHRTLR